jgi:mRNA interferase RelE/StbE
VAYTLRYHSRVKDDIERITPPMRSRIARAIESRLTQAPERFGVPLTGALRRFWKLRVGDYRVVFEIAGSDVVWILAIVHRRDGL